MDAFSDIKPVPLEVIASWPTPNYTNPERRGPALIIVNSILLPLALIVVGLRLYTRLRISRSAGWDDIFIALATVSLKLSDRSSRLLLTRLLIPTIGLTISVCLGKLFLVFHEKFTILGLTEYSGRAILMGCSCLGCAAERHCAKSAGVYSSCLKSAQCQ
jgi:hypothetical protein